MGYSAVFGEYSIEGGIETDKTDVERKPLRGSLFFDNFPES
jgi:hypothetical protein